MFTRVQPYNSLELNLINDATRSGEISPAYGLTAKYPSDTEELRDYLSLIEDRVDKKFMSPSGEVGLPADLAKKSRFPLFGRMLSDKGFAQQLSETVYTVAFENVTSKSLEVSVYLDGRLAATWMSRDGQQKINIKKFAKDILLPESNQLANISDQDTDFNYTYYYDEWSPHAPEMGPAWPSFGGPANFLLQLASVENQSPRFADDAFALITAVFHYPLSSLIRKYAWTFSSQPIRDLDSDWFFCGLGSGPGKGEHAGDQFWENSDRKRSSGKYILAREAICEAIAKALDSDFPNSNRLTEINSWIGGKAFLDSGYQIKVGLKICMPLKDQSSTNAGMVDLANKFEVRGEKKNGSKSGRFSVRQLDPGIEFLARIYLVDQAGRELRFSEVGTGFSQILPILTHLGISNNYLIRQPEVHLHPKLQSRVADCIVNSVAKDREEKYAGNIVVETHSEHIVLRFLRRIRDSYKDPLLHSSLTLYPSELALIYVKPEVDKSRVFLIRVDSSGEFIDGWPEGFFDERDEDLWG